MPSEHTAHVFIDTNIPLHFQRPDQIDWCNLTGVRTVNLVAAPVLLRELERQKVHNPSRALRERAGAFVKWLDGFMDDPDKIVRPGVQWLFIPHESQIDFASHNLSRDLSDDHLIASVLDYKADPGCPVHVATGDIGVKGKLKFRQINVLWLPDALKRPGEPDPLEQEIKELRTENLRLNSRIPKLSVAFRGGAAFEDIDIEDRRESLVPSLEAMRTVHPLLRPPGKAPLSNTVPGSLAAVLEPYMRPFVISEKRVNTYNEGLNDYFGHYQKYLTDLDDYQEQRRLSTQVEIVIANNGTAPASHIWLALAVPDGVRLTLVDNFVQEPEPPEPPPRPMLGDELLGIDLFHGVALPDYLLARKEHLFKSVRIHGASDPVITPDGRSIRFGLPRLQQRTETPLEPLAMHFVGQQDVRSFPIQYRLSADEISEPMIGEIHIRVKGCDK